MADARAPGPGSPSGGVSEYPEGDGLARKVGRAGLVLGLRRVLVMVILAITSVFVARYLGSEDFGAYAAGLGTVQLLLAFSDFGFTQLLGRELAQDPAGRGALMRATARVQSLWSVLPFLVLVALAVSAGLDDPRGQVMLVASPLVLVAGLGSVRQIYMVMFRVRFVAAVDLSTSAVGSAVVIAAAAMTHDPGITAAAFVLTSLANTTIIAARGFGLLDHARPQPGQASEVVRRAAPLGIASVLASAYFTIDLVMLGWLVEGPELGEYAVAVKFLSLIVAVPMLLSGLALPGLSMRTADPVAAAQLASRVLHWLVLVGLPLCAGAFIFAEPVATTVFGEEYAGAAPMIQVLAIAGTISLAANILGTLLISMSLVRPQLFANTTALVFNVAGNLALVPIYGAIAAAWVTVATEMLVVGWAIMVLSGRIPLMPLAAAVWRPAIATAALIGVALLLRDQPLVGAPACAMAFVVAVFLLRDWPEEFRPTGRGDVSV